MNRIEPKMPVGAYQTYRIVSPQETHFRPATCPEVDCPHYLSGWSVRVEGLGAALLHTARTSGRRYVERQIREGETWLDFPAGQSCFQESLHRVRKERPELYVVRDGDWRGNPTGRSRTLRAEDWIDDFGEHQNRLADQMKKG
jgi:hypothetical protein